AKHGGSLATLPNYRQIWLSGAIPLRSGCHRRSGIAVAAHPHVLPRTRYPESDMKLGAIAVDYDGTIATNGTMAGEMRAAIGAARDAGIAVLLATGRRLDDLRRVAGDLGYFDAVVA